MFGKGTIQFMHMSEEQTKSHSGMGLKANTCSITPIFPVDDRYTCDTESFVKNIVNDIYSSPGFGKI